jgi:hypothetical protein
VPGVFSTRKPHQRLQISGSWRAREEQLLSPTKQFLRHHFPKTDVIFSVRTAATDTLYMLDWPQRNVAFPKKTIIVYQCGSGWQCEHAHTAPPWEGAILLCKQCEFEVSTGVGMIDQSGRPLFVNPADA